MNTSAQNFVTVDEILADVLKLVDDERYEVNTKGHYTSQIQQALEGLAFDTFFQTLRDDFDFPVDNLTLPMPLGSFNIKHVYLYNGDKCEVSRSQKVWYKTNYFTKGNGYFADNKGNNMDPFIENSRSNRYQSLYPGHQVRSSADNTFYYNTENGMIMFGSACRIYSKVHIVYNGTGCDIGSIPIIPLFLREAVNDFVTEFTLRIKMAKDPRTWTTLWQIYDKRLNRDQQYGLGQGSWYRAEQRVKNMSTAERSDLLEYLGRSSWSSGF